MMGVEASGGGHVGLYMHPLLSERRQMVEVVHGSALNDTQAFSETSKSFYTRDEPLGAPLFNRQFRFSISSTPTSIDG